MSSTIKVKPDELADVIVKELQTYKQEVADDMKAACLECANDIVNIS